MLLLVSEFKVACSDVTAVRHFPFSKEHPSESEFIDNIVGFRVQDGALDEEDNSVAIKIWPDGMRQCRKSILKKADFKVAFVGCSYTFGCGVKAEDTMVWRLNDKYLNVAFDNWGMSGWGPAQMYLRMQYMFSQKQYDLVVYNAIFDHMFRTYKIRALGSFSKGSRYIPVPYANWDIFGRFGIRSVYDQRWPLESNLLSAAFLKKAFYGYKTTEYENRFNQESIHKNYDGEAFKEAMECHAEQINRMYELCRANNADFAVCVLEDLADSFSKKPDAVTNNSAVRCELINVDMPNSAAHRPENRVLNNPGFHPNKNVHKFWADRFSEWLDRKYGDRLK
ncbi:hypothetical protein IJT93_08075 [bacterium]|nr:hypothetical protein [bacterium]